MLCTGSLKLSWDNSGISLVLVNKCFLEKVWSCDIGYTFNKMYAACHKTCHNKEEWRRTLSLWSTISIFKIESNFRLKHHRCRQSWHETSQQEPRKPQWYRRRHISSYNSYFSCFSEALSLFIGEQAYPLLVSQFLNRV